jgi:hypothetical protein
MSKTQFQFGERIPGYRVAVFNERAVRAAAGILFFFGMVTFMNAMLLGNFQPTRVFVVAFLIDFTLRIFVNPKFSPSLILGQWIVRKQEPEYVGAPQKRFAWAIGFILAMLMLYMIVIKGLIGPINMLVCGTWMQGAVLAVFLVAVFYVAGWVYAHPSSKQAGQDLSATPAPQDPAEAERCKVPEFAKKIGHEQQWKLHNGCQ